MKRIGRVLVFSSLFIILSASAALAQWGYGPVVVFDGPNGTGNASSFGVGDYRNNRNEFGTLRNDSAYSVTVPNGYHVRLCEGEGSRGEGSGKCEEYGEGNFNLRYGATASYIRVTGPGGGYGGGAWNGGGQRGVIVYEDNFTGRSQEFGVGRYLNMNGGLGNVRNDKASTVVVQRGFRVRLCENEGNDGRGSGRCEDYGEGRFNLRYNDAASYIEVQRAGWGGGWGGGGWNNGNGGIVGWDNNGNGGNGGWNNNGNGGGFGGNRDRGVIVFADSNQQGQSQEFDVGEYRSDSGDLSLVGNDRASSVRVGRGYRVELCENEPTGMFGNAGKGRCEEYGPGSYNLRYNDKASYIRVWRSR